MAFKLRKVSIFYKIILLTFLFFTIYIGNLVFFPEELPTPEFHIIINKNQNLTKLADKLVEQNVIKNRRAFLIVLKLLNKDKKVTAGLYILKHPYSLWGLVQRITNGHPDQISITILDGWTFAQLKQYVDSLDDVKHLTSSQTEKDIQNTLKIKSPNLEGIFYPDTYYIAPNQTDLEIYQQAYNLMQLKMESLYLNRNPSANVKSAYQLITLASLIQKETANSEDMFLVSTVFNNRLKIGMKLQDDPAVFYGLRGREKVTRRDFQIDTPYNTYVHDGLPPTPICIPSFDALNAAAKPLDNTEVLYFVAIGNGRTKFSTSYKEHKTAVNKYLKK